jgi:tetratricopeptide (TPR) repeat protein
MRQIPDGESDKAVTLAYRYLTEGEDLLRMGQALYELENRFQTFDRKKIYEAVDKLRESATEDKEREYLSVMYLDSLIHSQTGFSERNDPAKAEELLRKISGTEHPVLAPLSVHRLASVSISNDPRLAMKLFREQIEKFKDCPLNGQASFLIGTCHRVLEEDPAALDQYMQTLREYPAAVGQGGDALEPYIRHALADTYIRIERKEDALTELKTIMECCPDYPYRKQVEDAIQQAQGGGSSPSPEPGGGAEGGSVVVPR